VCTLSETRFAHTWWPVKEKQQRQATGHEVHRLVPKALSERDGVAGGGREERVLLEDKDATAPYLYCCGTTTTPVRDDVELSGEGDGHDDDALSFFIYPGSDTAAARNEWLRLPDILTVLGDKYGLTPSRRRSTGCTSSPSAAAWSTDR